MKSPESPRPYFQKPAESAPTEERETKSKLVPKYVEIPALREHGFGPRNLFWGVAALFLAVVLLLAALFFAGAKAMLSLATALMTFTALFVLSRMHVFRQRNGGFLALAVVCLLGVVVPLLETGFAALKNGTFAFARPGTPAGSAAPATPGAEPPVPLLTQSFALTEPKGPGRRVRAVRDVKVVIDQKPFLIKTGEQFPFLEVKGGEAFFAVRDLRVSLPASVVEVIDPSRLARGVTGGKAEPEDPGGETPSGLTPLPPPAPTAEDLAIITQSAQQEAIRRYPALGVKDSMENAAFLDSYKRLKSVKDSGGNDFFANPEWPLQLAEYLAERSGWVRGGPPATVGPAPVLDPPTGKAPAGNVPPIDALDAGAGLPGGVR